MPENDEYSVSPGEEPSSPAESPAARARPPATLANRPAIGRMVGTPGVAARRNAAEREMLRSRLKRAQSQVEVVRQRRRRGDAGAVPVAAVASDPSVSTQYGLSLGGDVRKKRNPWLVVASFAGMIGVTVFCVLLWPMARRAMANPPPVSVAVSNPRASFELRRREPVAREPEARAGEDLPADPGAALTMGLAHLSTALERAGGGSPEEVLRKASKPGKKCMVVWTNDSVSLVFGGNALRPNSLAHELEDCAEAVSEEH
jgi:hypothetical protein